MDRAAFASPAAALSTPFCAPSAAFSAKDVATHRRAATAPSNGMASVSCFARFTTRSALSALRAAICTSAMAFISLITAKSGAAHSTSRAAYSAQSAHAFAIPAQVSARSISNFSAAPRAPISEFDARHASAHCRDATAPIGDSDFAFSARSFARSARSASRFAAFASSAAVIFSIDTTSVFRLLATDTSAYHINAKSRVNPVSAIFCKKNLAYAEISCYHPSHKPETPMNAVEIEQAVERLAQQPFAPGDFAFAFLRAFGNKETTIARLQRDNTNRSDLPADANAILQRNNIHIATCAEGAVSQTLAALRASPATAKCKAKFILATDGITLEAEDCASGDTLACDYTETPQHFGFFLPLAGISISRELKDNPFDIRATARLNRLYTRLLQDNPDWARADRREHMNRFMARLIFCFFAEDTNIFQESNLFTNTVKCMSAPDSSNTHEIITEIFRALNTEKHTESGTEAQQNLRPWAAKFPYVNGNLFSGDITSPRFSKAARSYLLHIGGLNWRDINPDIFGSMIQAVAEETERGSLGLHYTSVPNILKVLNPLFLDDLRAQLEKAGDSPRKLLNLRSRMSRIRVFDPACGSGNFLVIAYKQMRAIEAEINRRRKEQDKATDIPISNFRGIEIAHFATEIARLALVIAKYQCDERHRGQQEALRDLLPLDGKNWITCGNALRLDWLSLCPPTGTGVKLHSDDLLKTRLDQAAVEFDNTGGEIYVCSNPPYKGFAYQSPDQKADLQAVFDQHTKSKRLDYVTGWFMKAADYGTRTNAISAFVATNSICQGEQVAALWPLIFKTSHRIKFAYTSFRWSNLARYNAGVSVVIVGISTPPPPCKEKTLHHGC